MREYSKKIKIIVFGIVLGWFLLGVLSFIATPLTGDIRNFIGAANQAKYNAPNEFLGAIYTWELKGIGSRVFFWILYKITLLCCPYRTVQFEMVYGMFYLISMSVVVIIVTYLFTRKKKDMWYTGICFMLLMCSLMYTYCCNQLQNEMTGSILLLLGIAVFQKSERRLDKYIAGLLFGSVFYFKSALLIMGLSFLGAIVLLDTEEKIGKKIKEIWYYLLGAGTMVFGGIVCLWICYAQELTDMLDASSFQKTLLQVGFSEISVVYIIRNIVTQYMENCLRIPVLIPGACFSIYLLLIYLKRHNWYKILGSLMLQVSPILFIAISNCYFAYHYATFLFPEIIITIVGFNEIREKLKEKDLVVVLMSCTMLSIMLFFITKTGIVQDCFQNMTGYNIVFLTCVVLSGLLTIISRHRKSAMCATGVVIGTFMLFCCLYFTSVFAGYVQFSREVVREAIEGMEEAGAIHEQKVLYLDGGAGAYAIGRESYLRYFYALPLQRINGDSEEAKKNCYQESYDKMMSYTGDYLTICRGWFIANNEYIEVMNKIENEYEVTGKFTYPSIGWELFDYRDTCFVETDDIWERK